MRFKDKFITFIDLMGFRKLVEGAERGEGMSLGGSVEVVRDNGATG